MAVTGYVFGSFAIVVEYDPATGRFAFYRPGSDYPCVTDAEALVCFMTQGGEKRLVEFPAGAKLSDERPLQDEHGAGRQWTLTGLPFSGLGIDMVINGYDQRPFLLIRMIVHNQTGKAISLQDLTLLQATPRRGGLVQFGSQPLALDFFRVGWHDWV
jgi:hypothetical protein